MKRRDFVAGAGALTLAACTPLSDNDRKTIRWRMATAWPRNMPVMHEGARLFAERVHQLSQGQLEIELHAAGELMGALDVFDAASQNEIQCYHAASYYWDEIEPATAWFSSVPFGMNAEGCMAWLLGDEGLSLWQDIYRRFSIVPFPMGATGMQMGGWFKAPLEEPADLLGLRIRMPGLGGRIYEKLGAKTILLPPSELVPAMQADLLDATDWIGPHIDTELGLDKVASHYYYPGWHEPAGILELGINSHAYDALPQHLKAIVRSCAAEVSQHMEASLAVLNGRAIHKLRNTPGITVAPFPPKLLELFHRIADETVENEAGKSVRARRVNESYKRFMARWLEWGRMANLGYFDLMR